MRRIILFIILLFSINTFAQKPEAGNVEEKYKDLKTIRSGEDSKVIIEIRKPDNSSLMARKKSEASIDVNIDIDKKLKNSNKLLY